MIKKIRFLKKLSVLIILICVYGCREHKNETVQESIEPEENIEEYEEVTIDEQQTIGNTPTSPELEDYKVILSVDGEMDKGENGVLVVWIGASGVEVSFKDDMVQDETTIPSDIGQYAKITPFAPDFDIKNYSADACYKIDPSGSKVQFTLVPKSTGVYDVNVNIQLYESNDCSGAFVPKTSETLSVTVKVNVGKEASKKVNSLLEIVWENFVKFWGAFVALLFGALLFVIKKKIKKKTGYEEKQEEEGKKSENNN